ncbi:DNA-binding response regulator [Paenibacillus sp. 79R4]|nr:DNA-binding response regulator [Paenibacillus sp. 79R4]
MITIYLCDDNEDTIEKYGRWITDIAKRHNVEITLFTSISSEALLFHLSESPNQAAIIYMDILMGSMNGIEAARQLRESGCQAEIIFLTTSEDYVYDAFDISPVQYLLKSSTSVERFEEVFLRAVALSEKKAASMFLCEVGNTKQLIPIKDISYFEIWKRIIMVHYNGTDTAEFYGTMDQVEQQLQNKNFIRVHRSYLVSMPYISKFQPRHLLLKTGEIIPVGVTYMKMVRQMFSEYISQFNIHRLV